MTLTRLLLVVCAIATVHAQAPPRDQAPVPVPTGTAALQGTVVDEKHEPDRDALVTIKGAVRSTLAAVTEDDCWFSFSALPAGRFTITAEKAAYPAICTARSGPTAPAPACCWPTARQSAVSCSRCRGAACSQARCTTNTASRCPMCR